jgi:hypothetical protein
MQVLCICFFRGFLSLRTKGIIYCLLVGKTRDKPFRNWRSPLTLDENPNFALLLFREVALYKAHTTSL